MYWYCGWNSQKIFDFEMLHDELCLFGLITAPFDKRLFSKNGLMNAHRIREVSGKEQLFCTLRILCEPYTFVLSKLRPFVDASESYHNCG